MTPTADGSDWRETMGTFFYVVLAFLVGVLVGWFIWGRLRGELDSLRGDLDRTRSERDRLRADSDRLTGELNACGKTRADLERQLRDAQAAGSGGAKAASQPPAALVSTPAAAKSAPAGQGCTGQTSRAKARSNKTRRGQIRGSSQTRGEQTRSRRLGHQERGRSQGLQPPRQGRPQPPAAKPAAAKPAAAKADNLRRLIGIGPVNEKLLKGQGVTTFAQIAAWTDRRHQADRACPAISMAVSSVSAGSSRRSCWPPATRRSSPNSFRAREPPATPERRRQIH